MRRKIFLISIIITLILISFSAFSAQPGQPAAERTQFGQFPGAVYTPPEGTVAGVSGIPWMWKYFAPEIREGILKFRAIYAVPFPEFWIHYEFGETIPGVRTKKALAKVASFIKRFKKYRILIEGHTDNIYPRIPYIVARYPDLRSYSLGRAESAAAFFALAGVRADKTVCIGYGEDRPIALNTSNAGRYQNRRIVVKVLLTDEAELTAFALDQLRFTTIEPQTVAPAPALNLSSEETKKMVEAQIAMLEAILKIYKDAYQKATAENKPLPLRPDYIRDDWYDITSNRQ